MRISHPHSRRSAAVVAAASVLVLAAGAPSAFAQSNPGPAATPQTKAEAVLAPSLVYLDIVWKGWLRDSDGALLSSDPYTAETSCSGFVADSTGYIATAGHCVDDQTADGGKAAIIKTALAEEVQAGTLTQQEATSGLSYALANWKVEGTTAGSNPDRVVNVYQTVAASGVPVTTPMQANVVDVKPLSQGDVALLKVQPTTPMSAVELAAAPPQNGAQVIAAGYPGSVTEVVDPKLQPSFKEGSASSSQTVNGVPFVEVSAASTPGMSGGPAIDLDGRVFGTVSFGPSGENQAFNFITDTLTLRALLTSHGVATALTPADRAYRDGLADYFAGRYHSAAAKFDQVLAQEPNQAQAQSYRAKAVAAFPQEQLPSAGTPWLLYGGIGGAVLVLAAAVILILVLRRRRATRPAATPATGPGQPPAWPGNGVPTTDLPTPPRGFPQPLPAGNGHGEPMRHQGRLPAPNGNGAGSYCSNCGHPQPGTAQFCNHCGQRLIAPTPGS